MTERYKSLAEAQQALAHLNTLNRVKALAKVGVDWTIGPQSREAELARFTAKLNTIFAAGAEEARNPTNPALRSWNDANYEAQKNGGAGLEAQSGVAEAKEAARIHWQNRRSARA